MLHILVVTTSEFKIVARVTEGGVARVSLSGDFDMSVGTRLTDTLVLAAREPGATRVVVDLKQTGFLDSHGLAGLVAGYEAAVLSGRPFTVVNATGLVRQVFDITGLAEVLIGEEP